MTKSSTAPRATPAIPSGALFSPYAEAEIDAPAAAVYDALIDTSSWPKWNTFVPSATIDLQPSGEKESPILAMGTVMTLHVTMTPKMQTTSKEVVSLFDERPKATDPSGTIYRVCWSIEHHVMIPKAMLEAERVNEIEKRTDGTCVYRSFEAFKGPYARLIKWSLESSLQARFEDWVRDIKKFVETGKEGINVNDQAPN